MARHKLQHEAIVAQLELQHSAGVAALQQELAAQREHARDAQQRLEQLAAQRDSKREELQRWGEEQARAAREQLDALGQLRLELDAVRESERVAVASEAAWRAQLNQVADERRLEQAEQQGVRQRLHEALAALDHEREAATCRVAELAQVRGTLESFQQQLVMRNARCEALDRESHQLRHELRRLERLVYGKKKVTGVSTSRGNGAGRAHSRTNLSLQEAALLSRTADEQYGSGQGNPSLNSTMSHYNMAAIPSTRDTTRKPKSGRRATKNRRSTEQRTGRSDTMRQSGLRPKRASMSVSASASGTETETETDVPTMMPSSRFNMPLGMSSEHSMSSFVRAQSAHHHHLPASSRGGNYVS